VLVFLLERPGRLVSKQELFEAVWKESFVSDNALTRMIKEIRRVIGDDADAPRHIETVPKRGYRFISDIRRSEENPTVRPLAAGVENARLSIAVLPFINIGEDPDHEYLSEGITESLINNLSQIPDLRVVPRSTVYYFQGRETEPLAIGQKLNVQTVLTGRLTERQEQLIVSTELIDVPNQAQIWGEQYYRPLSDIIDLQQQISQKIFGELQLKLNPEKRKQLSHRPTQNVDAYQLYLKGRYFWNRRPQGLIKGLEYFEQALEKDPDLALAYVGIADAYNSTAYWENTMMMPPSAVMPKARAAAVRALEIDRNLAEAHASLANIRLHYDRDIPAAEESFRSALALNPNYAHAHHLLSHLYVLEDRIDESLAASLRALELDPLDIVINGHLIWHYVVAREPDLAIAQAAKTIELFPSDALGYLFSGLARELNGDYERAIEDFQKAQTLSGGVSETKAALGHALARIGETELALKIAEDFERQRQERFVSAHDIAIVFAGLGDKARAFRWLEQAVDERSGRITYLAVEPRWDRLRGEKEFSELVGRLGLDRRALR
jgi:TolB-like protein/Tfp pilus assembly protein PilF